MSSTVKKVQVVLDARSLATFTDLQNATGQNGAEVIRDALAFYDWARREIISGKAIATVEGSRTRELLLLPFEALKQGKRA